MKQLSSIVCRILFAASCLLAASAVSEKLANILGLTVLRAYNPWRILELSAVALLFVIALELREIKQFWGKKDFN